MKGARISLARRRREKARGNVYMTPEECGSYLRRRFDRLEDAARLREVLGA